MTDRSLVLSGMLLAALAGIAGCRSSVTSRPLPAADSAAIMAKAHASAAAHAASDSATQKPAVYVGGAGVSPHPAESGETVVQFVVDSTGAVRPSTFKVIRASDLALIDDVKRALRRWHYVPAEVDGRKVSQLVQTAVVR
jgi:hypothetical protein